MKDMMKYRPKPERPRPRQFKRSDRPIWVNLHPATMAPMGAVLFMLVMLAVYLVMYLFGRNADPLQMVIGVLVAFVLGYAVTGGFVYYLLHVAEREIPRQVEEEQVFSRRRAGASASAPVLAAAEEKQEAEQSEVEELE